MSSLTGTITGFPHLFIKGDTCVTARRNIVCHVGEPDQSREWIETGIFPCFYYCNHCINFARDAHQDAPAYRVLIASSFGSFL